MFLCKALAVTGVGKVLLIGTNHPLRSYYQQARRWFCFPEGSVCDSSESFHKPLPSPERALHPGNVRRHVVLHVLHVLQSLLVDGLHLLKGPRCASHFRHIPSSPPQLQSFHGISSNIWNTDRTFSFCSCCFCSSTHFSNSSRSRSSPQSSCPNFFILIWGNSKWRAEDSGWVCRTRWRGTLTLTSTLTYNPQIQHLLQAPDFFMKVSTDVFKARHFHEASTAMEVRAALSDVYQEVSRWKTNTTFTEPP